jgi:sodium/hydrogen antiporter
MILDPNQLTNIHLLGPYGANIFDPRSWGNSTNESINNITLEFTRVVIAIGLYAVGVELPKKYMYRHWKSLFFLLVPVMTWVRFSSQLSPLKAD